MSGISHLIYKWKVLSFSSKKILISDSKTDFVHPITNKSFSGEKINSACLVFDHKLEKERLGS